MTQALAALVVLLSAADHWTTWLCLRSTVAGWEVTEANPISDWLFARVGVAEGLVIDSVVTLLALAYLLRTPRVPARVKAGFLCVVVLGTGFAVVNNLGALRTLGLPLLPAG